MSIGELIERDKQRFRYLANEPKASIPDGYLAPLTHKTTRALIGERLRAAQGGTPASAEREE